VSPKRARPRVAVIGAGRLASALAPALDDAGFPVVSIAARTPAAGRSIARRTRAARVTRIASRAAAAGEVLLLAVPDREIEPLAQALAADPRLEWHGRTVLHHAGALGPEPLIALRRAGASVGVLHPLQCLGESARSREALPGSAARIEGDPAACRLARRLARSLGLIPLELPERLTASQRAAYHAAGSLVANDLLALLAVGAELLESIGLDREKALQALVPLALGTLDQTRDGLAAALTGPAVRGDVETLRAHLKRLARHSASAAEIHRLLSLTLVELAREEGRPAPAGTAARIRKLAPRIGRRG